METIRKEVTGVKKQNPTQEAAPLKELSELELLRDIQERLTRIEKRQKAHKRRGVIVFFVILSVIALLAWFAVPRVLTMYSQYNDIMTKIDSISKALDNVDLDAIGKMFNSLSSIDFDELKEQLAQLQEVVDNIKFLDIEALNGAVEKMDTALDPILKLFRR